MEAAAILLWEDDVEVFRSRVALAEELGYAGVAVGESPIVYRDLWVSLTLAALGTSTVDLSSMVMVAEGRHPALVASALSSLQQLSGGRLRVGIGTGASASTAFGRGPTRLADLLAYVNAVRALLDGRSIEWEGRRVRPLRHPRPVPFYLSAYGPRARKLAGAFFDGVILATGSSVPVLTGYIDEVRAAADGAARPATDVDIWVMSRIAVRDDRAEAIAAIKANLASAACFGLRSPAQMRTVPEQYRERVVTLQRRYDPNQHSQWDGVNARLVDELELGDYLAERFAVAGTPAQCRDQVAAMAKVGVSRLIAPAVDRDPEGLLRRLAQAIIDRQDA